MQEIVNRIKAGDLGRNNDEKGADGFLDKIISKSYFNKTTKPKS